MNAKHRAIAVGALSMSAVCLLVSIILGERAMQPVFASGVTASSGDYVVTVGSLSDRDEELVYVIDAAAQRMIVYRFDPGKKQIEIVQPLDLEAIRKSSSGQDAKKPGP